jgi:hypothetical protein
MGTNAKRELISTFDICRRNTKAIAKLLTINLTRL